MTKVPSEQDLAVLLEDLDLDQMQQVMDYLMQLMEEDVD